MCRGLHQLNEVCFWSATPQVYLNIEQDTITFARYVFWRDTRAMKEVNRAVAIVLHATAAFLLIE